MGADKSKPFSAELAQYRTLEENIDTNQTHLAHIQTQKQFLMRELTFNDKDVYAKNLDEHKKRQAIVDEHLTHLDRVEGKQIDHLCSNIYKIYALWEYPYRFMSEELTQRANQNRKFQERELWSILASCILAMSTLQKHKIRHESITTKVILLDGDGLVKVADPLALGTRSNLDTVYNNRQAASIYLSPEQCESLQSRGAYSNPFKNDVWSVGMIVLECGLLRNLDSVYRDEYQRIEYDQLGRMLNKFGCQYVDELRLVIELMLKKDSKDRPDWIDLEQYARKSVTSNKIPINQNHFTNYHKQEQNRPPLYNNPPKLPSPQKPIHIQPSFIPYQPRPQFQQPHITYQQPHLQSNKNQSYSPKPNFSIPPRVENNNNNLFTSPTLLSQFNINPIPNQYKSVSEPPSFSPVQNNFTTNSSATPSVNFDHIIPYTPTYTPAYTSITPSVTPSITPTYTYTTNQTTPINPSPPPNQNQPHITTTSATYLHEAPVEGEELEYVVQTFKQGSRYEGYKLHDMRHGEGKFYYQDGGLYDGNWKCNKMDGHGALYYQSGKLAYEGSWQNDQFQGKGKLYNQYPVNLQTPFDYRNFDEIDEYWDFYQGQFVEDFKKGTGKLQLSNGERFEGYFDNDMVEGTGVFHRLDGTTVRGNWIGNHLQHS